MTKPELAGFFKDVPLFARLSAERLAGLAVSALVTDCAPGEPIDEGDWSTYVWIVIQGLVRVAASTGPSAEFMTVFIAGRGEPIGCFDPQCSRRHELSSTAVVPTLVARVPRSVIHQLSKSDSEFSSGIIRMLNERLWECRDLRVVQAMTAEQRLARTLVLLSAKLGNDMPLTRRSIAELSGLARETAIRALGPLERAGVVRSVRGRIEVLQREKLEKLGR